MIHAALKLAEFFKCSPYEFLDRPGDEVLTLFHETLVMLREKRTAGD